MPFETITGANVKQAVPFLGVTNMEASLRFYVDGLGFKMNRWWIPDAGQEITISTGGFAGAGWSLARPRSCYRSLCLNVSRRKHWEGSQRLFSVRRRAGALSRVQSRAESRSEPSIGGKRFVGCARN